MSSQQLEYIPRSAIDADDIRDRRDADAIQGLAATIRAQGLIYPLVVQKRHDRFRLIDGHRRLAALDLLGETRIPVMIEGDDRSDATARLRSLISNSQREALSPLATARTIAEIMAARGWNLSETAAQVGFPQSRLTKILSYLKLPPELAETLSARGVGPTVAYQLSRIADPAKQREVAERYLEGTLGRDAIKQVPCSRLKKQSSSGRSRFNAPLSNGGVITIVGDNAGDIEGIIEMLQGVLLRLRQARAKGYSAKVLSKMLRDEAQASSESSIPT